MEFTEKDSSKSRDTLADLIVSALSGLLSPVSNDKMNIIKKEKKKIDKKKLIVKFSNDTLPGREVRCAITIEGSENISSYIVYHIRCWASGRSWILERRYRHFEALHKDLFKELTESYGHHDYLPELPVKRWFEKQRWINKYDAEYIHNRKLQLQEYLRNLLRNPKISVKSQSVSKFLEFELHTSGLSESNRKDLIIDETTRVSDVHFKNDELELIRNELNDIRLLDEIVNNQNIEKFDEDDDEDDNEDDNDDDDDEDGDNNNRNTTNNNNNNNHKKDHL